MMRFDYLSIGILVTRTDHQSQGDFADEIQDAHVAFHARLDEVAMPLAAGPPGGGASMMESSPCV